MKNHFVGMQNVVNHIGGHSTTDIQSRILFDSKKKKINKNEMKTLIRLDLGRNCDRKWKGRWCIQFAYFVFYQFVCCWSSSSYCMCERWFAIIDWVVKNFCHVHVARPNLTADCCYIALTVIANSPRVFVSIVSMVNSIEWWEWNIRVSTRMLSYQFGFQINKVTRMWTIENHLKYKR